jgi:alginate O-acetyltransferase complex protein AlgI
MLFQTFPFLILMLIVLAGIMLLRRARHQHYLLLLASYVFYAWWDVRFLILLLVSSTIDFAGALGIAGVRLTWTERLRLFAFTLLSIWFCLGLNWPAVQAGEPLTLEEFLRPGWEGAGIAIAACLGYAVVWPVLYELYFNLAEDRRRKAFLITSMCANVGMLAFFKYFNFFRENLVGLSHILGPSLGLATDASAWLPPELAIALPVGISFYTFVTMSYGIDAYRGLLVPERSFVRMALFVSYFPHLVAGPIIRPDQLLPTLNAPWRLDARRLTSGFHLVIWVGACLFAIQIYCDFSGYTDVARGVSRMLGVELPLNFNFPYFSTSITDFWRRWHISLSTWLRDYLYIPLGGSRVSPPRVYMNLLTTMAIGGLWHGASWNFVIWGCYQGVLLSINRMFTQATAHRAAWQRALRSPVGQLFCWAITLYFTLLGWLIFRVTDLSDLIAATSRFIVFDGALDISSLGLGVASPIVAVLACVVFMAAHTFSFFVIRWTELLDDLPGWSLPVVYVISGMIFFLGWPSENAQFIYFQF